MNDANDVIVTQHAQEEAKNKFKVPWKRADDWILDNFRKSTYIGTIFNENDEERRLFAYNRISFVLAPDRDVIITVYPRQSAPDNLRKAVMRVIESEKAKMERRLMRKKRDIEHQKAEIKIEIGERELERLATKSEAKKLALTARINALNAHFTILDADLMELKREKSTLLKGVAVYV